MPYGYIGQNTPNQTVSNSGVFSISDVASLEKQGKFGGSLELIEDKNITSSSSAIFTSIQENIYDVHQLSIDNINVSDNNTALSIRFFENGVEESATVYQYAYQYGDSGATTSGYQSTADDKILTGLSIGNGSGRSGNANVYLYNLGNSNKYSFVTTISANYTSTPTLRYTFGGGVLPQASLVNQIKLFVATGTFSARAKLFGIKQL